MLSNPPALTSTQTESPRGAQLDSLYMETRWNLFWTFE